MIFKLTIDILFSALGWVSQFFPLIGQNDATMIDLIVTSLSTFTNYLNGASWWFPVNFAWQLLIFTLVIESTFTGLFVIIKFIEIIKSLVRL